MHARPPQTHTSLRRVAVMPRTPTFFYFHSHSCTTVSPPPSARLSLPLSLPVWVFQPLPLVSGVRKKQIIQLEGNQLWARVAPTSTPQIQHVTTAAAAATPASSGMLVTSGNTNPTSCQSVELNRKYVQDLFLFISCSLDQI